MDIDGPRHAPACSLRSVARGVCASYLVRELQPAVSNSGVQNPQAPTLLCRADPHPGNIAVDAEDGGRLVGSKQFTQTSPLRACGCERCGLRQAVRRWACSSEPRCGQHCERCHCALRCRRPAPGQHRGGRRGRGAAGVLRLRHDGHHPRRRARGPARALLRRVPEGAPGDRAAIQFVFEFYFWGSQRLFRVSGFQG